MGESECKTSSSSSRSTYSKHLVAQYENVVAQYENVVINHLDGSLDSSKQNSTVEDQIGRNLILESITTVTPRKKLGSSRRALWQSRRRSRSIDSSDVLCDYSSVRRSSRLLTFTGSANEEENSSDDSEEYAYEAAVPVSLIKGASLVQKKRFDRKRTRLNLGKKSMSVNDVDYENVRLQSPFTEAVDRDDNIYDDPWNSADILQIFMRKQSLVGGRIAPPETLSGGALGTNGTPGAASRCSLYSEDLFTNLISGGDNDIADITDLKPINTGSPILRPAFKVNTKLPLLQQSWYHDELSRSEADAVLEMEPVGAFLVRINSLKRKDLTLSLKTIQGIVHIIATRQKDCRYILGQFSEPFESAASMIQFYSENELKINGAPHTYLTLPVHCMDHSLLSS